MIKRFLFFNFLFLMLLTAQAQDVIAFRDSTFSKVNIVEITKTTVLYSKFKSSSDRIFSVNKHSISFIKFADGRKEFFELSPIVKHDEIIDSAVELSLENQVVEKKKKVFFNAKIGIAYPIGALAASSDIIAGTYGVFGGNAVYQSFGDAGLGYLVGIKTVVPFTKFGLGAFVGFDVVMNRLKRSARTQLQDDFTLEIQDEWEKLKKFSTKELTSSYMVNNLYFNVPIVAGLNYTHRINNKVGFYGEIGAGCNIFKSTWLEGRADLLLDGESFRIQEYYEWDKVAVSFCYQAAVGLLFFNRFNVDIRYYGIQGASTNYRYKRITPERDYDAVEGTTKFQGVNFLTLSIGVFF